ncbi:hypothetical protein LB419_32715, partial [Klebsiella pneumoniae]|nr:hypothetical protein [Klebsiella pneumoniae]
RPTGSSRRLTPGSAQAQRRGQALITFQAALLRGYFAGWRYAYPAYGVQSQYVNRRRTWGR